MNNFLIALLIGSFCFSAQDSMTKIKYPVKKNFIDNIKSDDLDIQATINTYKKDFENQRDQIDQKYTIKKETLRNHKQQEIEQLRMEYKKKIDKLRNRYPKKIKSFNTKDSKAKNLVSPIKKHTKPLNKKNNKYADPRTSKTNFPKNVKESSKKAHPLDCSKSCCVTKKERKSRKGK